MDRQHAFALIAIVIGFLLTVGLLGSLARPVQSQTVDACIELNLSVGGATVTLHSDGCHEPQTPAETPTAAPTGTPAPEPSPTPGPTPEPVGDGEPYADAPACPEPHDKNAYHGIWNEDDGCHYDHTHGDDPHEVDGIFGTESYGWLDGEIGYAWETPDENLYKHGGYTWHVREYDECQSQFARGCVMAFRTLAHGVGATEGAVTPFHSMWLEALVCAEADPSDCGIVRVGGHQGPADLIIDGHRVLDWPDSQNRHFLSGYYLGNSCCETWYTGLNSRLGAVALGFRDRWSQAPPGEGCVAEGGVVTCDTYYSTPEELVAVREFICDSDGDGSPEYEDCRYNDSYLQPHIVAVDFHPSYDDAIDPDGDGRALYDGYSDRFGAPVEGCTEIGLDCIPLRIEGYNGNDGPRTEIGYQKRDPGREYDLCFDGATGELAESQPEAGRSCGQGESWSGWFTFPIEEPNG